MNQFEIGKFIKSCRKEKGLTQQELADRLMISYKTVSKWECGLGMPDVSLMLPLCRELSINVNELLTGEHIPQNRYMEKSEQTIIQLKQEIERKRKRMLVAEVFIIVTCLIAFVTLIISTSYVEPLWLKIIMGAIGSVILIGSFVISVWLEFHSVVYKCPNCGAIIKANFRIINAMHCGWSRYFKCPECGKKSWMHNHFDDSEN